MVDGSTTVPTGQLQLSENGGDFQVSANSATTLPVTLGTMYTLKLVGDYTAGVLTLTATLTSGSSSISVSDFDTTPQTGTFFGYRDGVAAQSSSTALLNVDYDDFSLVPEPGGLAIAACAAGVFLGRVRRRHPSRPGRHRSGPLPSD